MQIEKYRENAENFLSELDKEYYLHFSGQKDELNTAEIYEHHMDLFSIENFKALKDLKEKSNGEERKKYSHLFRFCAEGHIENKVKELADEIGEDEAKSIITIEGKDVPFRYSEVLLSNEPDKSKRDIIDDTRNMTVERSFNPKLLEYWDRLHKETEVLGFSSYVEFISFLKEQDLNDLMSQMERLLAETGELHEEHFGSLLQDETGIRLDDSRRSDFAFLRRAQKYDSFFKKEILVDVFRDTLMAMGIDLNRQPNIILDVGERKNKSPRAFCATVRVPDEIYLVVMPKGGQDDYEAMFHEGGHAEHFSCARRDLAFEFKYLGDNAVTEGYAFTLEHIMQNKEWLSYFLKMSPEQARSFAYFSNITKLWFCRRYAGKLKYELLLHDKGPIAGKKDDYAEILTSSTGMQYHRADYLKDVDEGFYCTNYIRAWIFEAQLKDHMHQKFGYSWFKSKKAGDFLQEIWSYGQKYSPEEVLSQLGFNKLDICFLIDSLVEGIKNNK